MRGASAPMLRSAKALEVMRRWAFHSSHGAAKMPPLPGNIK